MKLTHTSLLYFLLIFNNSGFSQTDANSNNTSQGLTTGLRIKLNNKSNLNHLTTLKSVEIEMETARKKQDTLLTARLLHKKSDLYTYIGQYDLAYDALWDALLLTESIYHNNTLLLIHRNLGHLYDLYNKDSLALSHLKTSLNISKKLVSKKIERPHQLISSYFSLASFWRQRNNYSLSLKYLDSCQQIAPARELPYVMTDKGYCYMQQGKLEEAKELLTRSLELHRQKGTPYEIVTLSFLGDLKKILLEYDEALDFYKQSLELQEKLQVHKEKRPEILQKTSDIYVLKGDLKNALNYLKASKNSSDKLFSTTSRNNKRLFEIKNKYAQELTQNKKLILTQQEKIEENKSKMIRAISVFVFIILLVFGAYIFYYQKAKIKKLSLVRQHDKDKTNAVLEVKSKELTAHALKMIEKEEAVQTLLEIIKKDNPKEYHALANKYAKGSDNSWEEFNLRFTEVNNTFYESLCKKHPNLSATELKHCALIKLNFNSHEMSKFLNISLQSVHTSRYRIRKKIGLDSNSSLETYIGAI